MARREEGRQGRGAAGADQQAQRSIHMSVANLSCHGRAWRPNCGNVCGMHVGMIWNVVRVAHGVLLLVVGCARAAFAQATPATAASPPKEPTTLLERMKEPDQGGGLHFTEALGRRLWRDQVGVGHRARSGDQHQVRERRLRPGQGRLSRSRSSSCCRRATTRRKFWDDRASRRQPGALAGRAEARALSAGTRRARPERSTAASEKTEASARLRLQLQPTFRVGAGFGIETVPTTRRPDRSGALPARPARGRAAAARPGHAALFAHAFFSAAHDSRTSPDYSRAGSSSRRRSTPTTI